MALLTMRLESNILGFVKRENPIKNENDENTRRNLTHADTITENAGERR